MKVGERLVEETSRAGSELQIARVQEVECRQVRSLSSTMTGSTLIGLLLVPTGALYVALSHYWSTPILAFFIQPKTQFGSLLLYQCNFR